MTMRTPIAGSRRATSFPFNGIVAAGLVLFGSVHWLQAQAPFFLQQPASTNVSPGGTAVFSVAATGAPPVRLQWKVNGVNLPNETNNTLAITNALPQRMGAYQVTAHNAAGAVDSLVAVLTVNGVPALPTTDDFAQRGSLGSNSSGVGVATNLSAGLEMGEPVHGKPGGASLWLKWQPDQSGIATFRTTGSSLDTLLAVYTGNVLNALQRVAADDDRGGFLTSEVRFNVQGGTEYQIALDGYYAARGRFVLSWDLEATSDRLPVILSQPPDRTTGPGGSVMMEVVATNLSGMPLSYQWHRNDVPLTNETDSVLLLTNVTPAAVGLYTVSVTATSPLTNRTVLSRAASLQINVTGGGFDPNAFAQPKFREAGDPTQGPFLVGRGGGREDPGKNAAPAGGFTGTQIFSTYGSVKEPGEPNHCGVLGGYSVWFTYAPPTNGFLTVDTIGSSFNTILAAYTWNGVDFSALNPLNCANVPGAGGESITVGATNGTTCYIVVDGVSNAFGTVHLNYSLVSPPVILTNPVSRTVQEGSNVTLTAAASGVPTPLLRWRFNSNVLAGATNTSLTRTNFQPAAEGAYDLVATNAAGAATSSVARLYLLNANCPAKFMDSSNTASGAFTSLLLAGFGSNYIIQASTNLSNWVALRTNVFTNGLLQFTDTNAAAFSNRYYRLVAP
jgi:hypothetical protein